VPPFKATTVVENTTEDVPALKVRFVAVKNDIAGADEKVVVLALNDIDLIFELLDDKAPAVIA
jgi:hypothetical protein